jgi:hypothetical protein
MSCFALLKVPDELIQDQLSRKNSNKSYIIEKAGGAAGASLFDELLYRGRRENLCSTDGIG